LILLFNFSSEEGGPIHKGKGRPLSLTSGAGRDAQ
jgi:hypothetical protein